MDLRSGCCNGYGGPDFSKMDFKKLEAFCTVFHINWCEGNLWISVAAIVCLPALCSVLRSTSWCPVPGVSSSVFTEILAFVLGGFKLLKFHQMTRTQPLWDMLQNPTVLLTGYLTLTMGLVLYLLCLLGYGPWDTLFRTDFREPSQGSSSREQKSVSGTKQQGHSLIPPLRYRDLCKVLKTAFFCCQLGYSLICASQAGMLVTVLQALAHCYGLTSF